jgi:hypothetical protein
MVSTVPTKTTQNLMFESIISLYLKSILFPRVLVCLISYLAGSLLEERSTRKGWLLINHKELSGKCLLKASHQIIIKLIRGWYSQDCLETSYNTTIWIYKSVKAFFKIATFYRAYRVNESVSEKTLPLDLFV